MIRNGKVKVSIFGIELGLFEMDYMIVASGGEVKPVAFKALNPNQNQIDLPDNIPMYLKGKLSVLLQGNSISYSALDELKNEIRWRWTT